MKTLKSPFIRLLQFLLLFAIAGWTWISIAVEIEAPFRQEILNRGGQHKALIIFHPSWIDHFQDDLTSHFARGLGKAGWTVDRVTASSANPPNVEGYDLVVLGTNTYYWRPDLPTKSLLAKLNLKTKLCVGLVSGAGSTGRAERVLKEAIERAHGTVSDIHSFWLWRPNDKKRLQEDNRKVALEQALELGVRIGNNSKRG